MGYHVGNLLSSGSREKVLSTIFAHSQKGGDCFEFKNIVKNVFK